MRYCLLLLLTAAITCCKSEGTGKTGNKDFNLDSVKAHILKMNGSYSQRFTSNDSVFYAERYCVDAQVYSPAVPAVMGRDSIRSFFYNGGNNKEAMIDLPPGNIYGTADLVVEDGTYSFPDGKGGVVDKGKFIALWKKEEGTWKLYREIWNTDLAPAAPSK